MYLNVYQLLTLIIFLGIIESPLLIISSSFCFLLKLKILFFHITVHSVHRELFHYIFSGLQGEYTVKSEQWIVHPRRMMAVLSMANRGGVIPRGGKKVFLGFIVHSVHLDLFHSIFSELTGEYTVNSEQWIVHPGGFQIQKDRRMPV